MIKIYTSLLVLSFLFTSNYVMADTSDEKTITRTSIGQPIDDLVLSPVPQIQKDMVTGKSTYVVKGIYFRENWDLVVAGKRIVPDSSGVFYLKIPIKGETTTVDIYAKGSGKQTQSEKISIFMPDVKAAATEVKPTAEVKPVTEEKPVEAEVSKSTNTTTTNIKQETHSNLDLKTIYLAPVMAVQSPSSQQDYSFTIGWNPSYHFSPKWAVRLSLGAMAFKKAEGGSFLATDTLLLYDWNFYDKFALGIGGGFQYWWGFGGIKPETIAELSYAVGFPLFSTVKVDRIFGDISWFFDSLNTKQARVGVALAF